MRVKSLKKALCVVMLLTFMAQPISWAEGPVSGEIPVATLFAYTSSIHRSHPNDSHYANAFSYIPSYVPLELTPVDPIAWSHATLNSSVRLRVVHDVILGKDADAYAGTLIDAKVTRIREGKLRIRRGRIEPRVKEVTVEGTLRLTLESTPRSNFSRKAKHLITLPVTGLRMAFVLAPLYVFLLILSRTGFNF